MQTPRSLARALGCAAIACAALSAPQGAFARSRAPAQATAVASVDVSRLRALGLGPTADVLAATVARSLAGGTASGGRVAVRLTGLSLNSFAGSGSATGGSGGGAGGSGGASDVDYLEGDVLILGPRGEVLSSRHQVVSSPSSSGGAYYLPGAEMRRVEVIGQRFADWARRL